MRLQLALLHMTFTELSWDTLTVWALHLGSVLCLAHGQSGKILGKVMDCPQCCLLITTLLKICLSLCGLLIF